MKSALKASAAMALLAAHTPAYAQEAFDLGEITLFSNQNVTELSRSGTTTEVVTEEEIEDAPDTKVSDTLAKLPGITVSANGGVGAASTLRIRGLGAGYVPVILDGIDISDPASTGAGYDWGGLTTGGLSRIEVLKGAQSARYGVNAAGGVVNLSSFRPTKDGFSGQSSVEFGSYGTKSATLGLGLMDERTEIGFSLSRFETDGFSAVAAGTEPDGYEATQASLFVAHNLTDTARVGFNLIYIESEGQYDEFGGDGAFPYDEYNTNTTYGTRIFSEFETGAVRHELEASYFDIDRVSYYNGSPSPFKGDRTKIGYKASYDPSDTLSLTFGVDRTSEKAGTSSADINSAFVELAYAATDQLDVTTSLRVDDHSDHGSLENVRVAAAYRFSDDVILRAQAATGYKPPTLFQRTSNANNGGIPLTPEKNSTFELGIEKLYGEQGFVKATAFYNDLKNNVFYDPCTGSLTCYGQTDFKSKGIELSGAYALNDIWEISAAYTYTDAYRPSGRAGRVPRHDLFVGVQGDFASGWAGGLGINYVAGRIDRDDATTEMPNYRTVNANLSYNFNETTSAYLRVENLFDEDYETAGSYGTSGRAAYFGIRASF